MIFWERFEAFIGPPAARPETYWFPALGHWCHLRPDDLAEFGPNELMDCLDFIDRSSSG